MVVSSIERLLHADLISYFAGQLRNPLRQTLQFVPTATFDKSNEAVSSLVSKIQGLLKTQDWNQFASARFVQIANELRRMDRQNIEAFRANTGLRYCTSPFPNRTFIIVRLTDI